MGRKLTTEEYKKRVYELVQDEYEVLDDYEGSRIPVKLKHQTCGTEFEAIPYYFLKARKCPTCHPVGRQKKTTEQFKTEVYTLVGEEYEVMGTYKGAMEKIEMKHVTCGTMYAIRPSSFLNGKRCSICENGIVIKGRQAGKRGRAKKTTAQFKEELFQLVGNEYQLKGEYQGVSELIEVTHQCGYTYQARPSDLLSGRPCPICSLKEKQRQKRMRELEQKALLIQTQYRTDSHIHKETTTSSEDQAAPKSTRTQQTQQHQPMNRLKVMVQKLKSRWVFTN